MTTTPVDPAEIDAAVAREMRQLKAEGKLEVRFDPRCRVCSDDATRQLINHLLSLMLSYRDVHEIVNRAVNPTRKANDQKPITKRIIAHHAAQHYDVMHPARAVWRKIGERRATQLGRDYENGVGGAVTHLAYLETMMHRGYETLVDPMTRVEVIDGMKAAVQLAEIERKTAGEQQHAEMLAQVNAVIGAVKDTVPPEMWETIVARLNGAENGEADQRSLPSGREDDDDEFDPGRDEDFDDDDED